MKKRDAFLALLPLFCLRAVAAPPKIADGLYVSSDLESAIRIERGNHSVCGDTLEIRLGETETVRYTIFSRTSFGNHAEMYSLAVFGRQPAMAGTTVLRNEIKLRRKPI